MKAVAEELNETIRYHAESIGEYVILKKIAEELGLQADSVSSYPHPYEGKNAYVVLHYYGWGTSESSEQAAAMAKQILPKVGRIEKSFNEDTRDMEMRCTYKGIDIILRFSTPNTCTVEKVEEEVEVPEVPAVPAHTEKKVRYVLKGDCDPLMSKVAETPEETVSEVPVEL